MTTIVGLRADEGKKGIVLASDLSGTRERWEAKGDVAVREQTKHDTQKIYYSDDRKLAVCSSGRFDTPYVAFLTRLLKGEIDFEKVLEDKKGFPEFRDLNISRWQGMIPTDDSTTLLIATRYNKTPRLHSCYPLGAVIETDGTSIGSGSKYALDYLSNSRTLIPGYLTLRKGIDLAVESLDRAARDIYTGGLDLTVVTKDKIHEFGKDLSDSIEKAKRETVEEIKQRL